MVTNGHLYLKQAAVPIALSALLTLSAECALMTVVFKILNALSQGYLVLLEALRSSIFSTAVSYQSEELEMDGLA